VIATVYLWRAGTAEGVTDTPRKARIAAARCERGGRLEGAGRALVVEQARFVPGTETLRDGYLRTSRYWTGRRHPDGRVTWRLHAGEPGAVS
jgi:hypothetical protein